MLIWFSVKVQYHCSGLAQWMIRVILQWLPVHITSYGQGNGSCILRKYNHHFFAGIIVSGGLPDTV